MGRIDVHGHFLPNLDDGCRTLEESLTCLRMLAATGYDRVFCTPHCGTVEFADLTTGEVAECVRSLQGHVDAAGIGVRLKAGGELRLSENIAQGLPEGQVPTYGHAGRYVLTDLWEKDWPPWAGEVVEWLQRRGHMVIVAHPERMPALREKPERIEEIAELGVLFQGNLGPIGGGDAMDVVALSRRYLVEGRYFMVGTDGHRPVHMGIRLAGLKIVERLVGPEKLWELTERNPGRLWGK